MDIESLLRTSKTIAVVGLSDKPERPSYDVASYLLSRGYTIIPVNPNIREWRGIRAYPSLSAIPRGTRVDIVDVFRKSQDVPPVVEEAIGIRARAVWMQLGIANKEASEKAGAAGLFVVMDRCMKIERMKMKD
jgi:predicted CoA-binding protein